MLNDNLYTSNKKDWETPKFLYDLLNEEFKFVLDVCANKHNAKCKNFLSPEIDALEQTWTGPAWMNPPYGRGIEKWVKKAFESDCICVCLLPVRSDTKWWHNYVMKSAEIRLLSKRLSFEGSTNKAPFPAAIVIFNGKNNFPKLSSLKI